MQGMSSTTPERLATQRNLPVEATRRLLRRNAYVNLVRLLGKLHGRDSADIVAQLAVNEQCKLLEHLPTLELVTSIFTYLDEETRTQVMPQLSTARLTAIVRHLCYPFRIGTLKVLAAFALSGGAMWQLADIYQFALGGKLTCMVGFLVIYAGLLFAFGWDEEDQLVVRRLGRRFGRLMG